MFSSNLCNDFTTPIKRLSIKISQENLRRIQIFQKESFNPSTLLAEPVSTERSLGFFFDRCVFFVFFFIFCGFLILVFISFHMFSFFIQSFSVKIF